LKISQQGIDLIKKFEGLKLQSYLCPAGVWTLGYGSTKNIRQGMTCTSEQAEALLRDDMRPFEAALYKVYPSLSQLMFDALVSFSFNLGTGWMRRSGLKDMLDKQDYRAAADELLKWNKAGGKVLAGLTTRRSAERDLFLQGLQKDLAPFDWSKKLKQ
jgi:lysozyme